MPYLFATQNLDYSDYSSGRVIYNLPGAPAFPIRLASEILQRARQLLGTKRPLALYDPTCGGAYHLTALGFLHGEWIESISASDIDPEALALARRNLGLLSPRGLEQRVNEIEKMLEQFGKPSHADALRSAATLSSRLKQAGREIPSHTFLANALDRNAVRQGLVLDAVDLVISDIPYGNLSNWQSAETGSQTVQPALWQMLDALLPILGEQAIVAIAADKRQKVAHTGYRRAGHFGIGKREVTFLLPGAPNLR
jgi:hypothetical protein